jgi:cysteine-rich CPCC protein
MTELNRKRMEWYSGPCPCCGHYDSDSTDPVCDICLWQRVYADEMNPNQISLNNNGISLASARNLVSKLGSHAGRLVFRSGGMSLDKVLMMSHEEVGIAVRKAGLDADYS